MEKIPLFERGPIPLDNGGEFASLGFNALSCHHSSVIFQLAQSSRGF
jgi:hypothetical protein